MGQTQAWAVPSPAAFITTLVVLPLGIFSCAAGQGHQIQARVGRRGHRDWLGTRAGIV